MSTTTQYDIAAGVAAVVDAVSRLAAAETDLRNACAELVQGAGFSAPDWLSAGACCDISGRAAGIVGALDACNGVTGADLVEEAEELRDVFAFFSNRKAAA
jgi:hypothetical protein